MKTVLSTKMLSPSQKELFLNSGLGLVEYDALKIEQLDVKIPFTHSNYIFTSKNAVKAFLKQTNCHNYYYDPCSLELHSFGPLSSLHKYYVILLY